MASKKGKVNFPKEVLEPVNQYLTEKLSEVESKKKKLQKTDPFGDSARLNDNAAVDADAAEQVGHMQASAFKHSYEKAAIQLRKALSRLKFGKYGLCERCGQMIDTDRLAAMPTATLCLSCEKKKERK
jgi:DnaK suppressor protein